ncbi:MAG TPA: hypothetical protein VLA43_13065 [Longimicrobiales bacterium]|nr:hypothetical protein [Longimicrobiales bacterium]
MRRRSGLAAALAFGVLLPGSAAAQDTHVLAVVGLGGDPAYAESFLDWGLRIRAASVERFGLAEERVTLLSEDPGMDAAVDGRSDRAGVEAAVAAMADRAGPRDRILVVLVGHGSFRGDEARFNLPGPDLTAQEWGALLTRFGDRPVALVNASSSSGPFVQALSAPGRILITATKTGGERNETQFGRFFAEALEGDAADLDKDGMLSLLEAFTYARAEVARFYQESNLLLTEHALLDDDGDGEGSEEPSRDGPDGASAAVFRLVPPTVATAPEVLGDSVLVRLMNERAELETRVARLRAIRETLDPAEYEARLEELLVEIALKNREINARGGGGA